MTRLWIWSPPTCSFLFSTKQSSSSCSWTVLLAHTSRAACCFLFAVLLPLDRIRSGASSSSSAAGRWRQMNLCVVQPWLKLAHSSSIPANVNAILAAMDSSHVESGESTTSTTPEDSSASMNRSHSFAGGGGGGIVGVGSCHSALVKRTDALVLRPWLQRFRSWLSFDTCPVATYQQSIVLKKVAVVSLFVALRFGTGALPVIMMGGRLKFHLTTKKNKASYWSVFPGFFSLLMYTHSISVTTKKELKALGSRSKNEGLFFWILSFSRQSSRFDRFFSDRSFLLVSDWIHGHFYDTSDSKEGFLVSSDFYWVFMGMSEAIRVFTEFYWVLSSGSVFHSRWYVWSMTICWRH